MRGGGKKGTVTESRAIQDTYLLKEKPAADAAGESEETNEK
jgi:hypothetical protein